MSRRWYPHNWWFIQWTIQGWWAMRPRFEHCNDENRDSPQQIPKQLMKFGCRKMGCIWIYPQNPSNGNFNNGIVMINQRKHGATFTVFDPEWNMSKFC